MTEPTRSPWIQARAAATSAGGRAAVDAATQAADDVLVTLEEAGLIEVRSPGVAHAAIALRIYEALRHADGQARLDPPAAPPRAAVDVDAVHAWWRSPSTVLGSQCAGVDTTDELTVGQFLSIDEDTFYIDDPIIAAQLPALVAGADRAGLFGLPDHHVGLWALADRDGVHDGFLLTVQLPSGLRLAGYQMAVDDLLGDDDLPVEQAQGALDAAALTVNELLAEHQRHTAAPLPPATVGLAAVEPRAAGQRHPAAAAFTRPNPAADAPPAATLPIPGIGPAGRPRSR